MHYVRQHRSVHLFVFRPIGAVHVRDVEIVALVAPAFVEDLFEFFFRIEVHAKVYVDSAGTRRWRRSIGVNDKKRGGGRPATESPTTAATGRAIDDLPAISADFKGRDALNERRHPPIAQAIPDQLGSSAGAGRGATTILATRRRIKKENDAVSSGLQLGILTFRDAGNRENSLGQSVKINCHGHRLSLTTWNLRLI